MLPIIHSSDTFPDSGLQRIIPDGANILIVHLQTAESCIINVDGFWQGIEENTENPDAFVEVQVVEGEGSTETSFNVVSDALQAHDDIDVIYCINDTSASGRCTGC